jgi:transcriptional regulator with XRE-family HTH domain
MTQRELASKAGLTHATISRLETGKHRPYFSTIRKLARALGVSPKVLVQQ